MTLNLGTLAQNSLGLLGMRRPWTFFRHMSPNFLQSVRVIGEYK